MNIFQNIWLAVRTSLAKPEKQFFRLELNFDNQQSRNAFYAEMQRTWNNIVSTASLTAEEEAKIEVQNAMNKGTNTIVIVGNLHFYNFDTSIRAVKYISTGLYSISKCNSISVSLSIDWSFHSAKLVYTLDEKGINYE